MKDLALNINEQLRISKIIEKHGPTRDNLIAILLEVQSLNPKNYIPREVAAYIGESLNVHFSNVYDVISFYSALSDKPKGRHVIQICESTTCMVTKHQTVRDFLEKELGILVGQTTSDEKFTLEFSPCFGACDIAPAIKIGPKVFGNLDEFKIKEMIKRYRRI